MSHYDELKISIAMTEKATELRCATHEIFDLHHQRFGKSLRRLTKSEIDESLAFIQSLQPKHVTVIDDGVRREPESQFVIDEIAAACKRSWRDRADVIEALNVTYRDGVGSIAEAEYPILAEMLRGMFPTKGGAQ